MMTQEESGKKIEIINNKLDSQQSCPKQNLPNNIIDLVGNTPILKLSKIAGNISSKILAKLEFFNPGGSIKDRIGIQMIEAAEKQGLINPGYTIVEPTSGNTGLGLAMAAIVKGYKMVFTLPDKMSQEKIDLLKAFGARVIVTPTNVPPDHPTNYVKVAEKIVKETPNSFMPNQYFNFSNPETHYKTTGPEIWNQTNGTIDILVASMGTGGTISGVGRYLKEKNPNIRIVGVDPEGSLYHHEFYHTQGKIHSYKVEGIGEDFLPSTLNLDIVDEIVTVSDKEAFLTARKMAREEGIFAGGSAGAAVFAALKVAEKLKESKNIVVIIPDTGRNYLNKIYSDEWMIENGLLESKEQKIAVEDILANKSKKIEDLIYVDPESEIELAINLMEKYGVSQLPVISDDLQVGSIREIDLMRGISESETISEKKNKIKDFMTTPLPAVNKKDKLSSPLSMLKTHKALLVLENGKATDIITTIDVINYLLRQ